MAGKKRRTEIQIETHEITIIRYGAVTMASPSDAFNANEEVQAYSEQGGPNANDQLIEILKEHDTREPGDDK